MLMGIRKVFAILLWAVAAGILAWGLASALGGRASAQDTLPETGLTEEEMSGDMSGVMMGDINLTLTGYDEWLEAVCKIRHISPNIARAIIERESSWQADAVNPESGAAGLMQIAPATWAAQVQSMEMCYGFDADLHLDPLDPYDNVRVGLHLLSGLTSKYPGNLEYALDCYALGEGGALERVIRLDVYEPTDWTQAILARARELTEAAIEDEVSRPDGLPIMETLS